jgi:hypothetical protein|tara:strand:- start:933 stop:1106 length:174 start_codon:yes stop_codon:yes gene_type:complete
MKEQSKKQRVRYNPIAKDLRTPKYKQRIKRAKSKYDENYDIGEDLEAYYEDAKKPDS